MFLVFCLLYLNRRVYHDAFFCVERLLFYVGTFYERNDRQVEMFGECVVAAVMCRHRHDGSRAVSGEYVVADINRYFGSRYGIHGIGSGEYSGDFSVGYAFEFRAVFHYIEVLFHGIALCFRSYERYVFTFRCEHHECHAVDGVGSGGEYGDVQRFRFYDLEVHFGAFAASDPVTLRVFDGF